MIAAAWICLLAPLAGGACDHARSASASRAAAPATSRPPRSLVAFVGALVAFVGLLGRDARRRSHSRRLGVADRRNFHVGLSILLDPLSVFMMLIVSGVGFLIVAYSIGYMDGDDEERRYFAYMALFVFSMLLLVQAGNLLILLAGWGLVGLCSYLLIGFWHERPSAIAAAKKAFIMNAFGDATLALALFLLIQHTGTLDFAALRPRERRRPRLDGRQPGRARPARRRGREVGAAPAPDVASRTRWRARRRSAP